MMLSESQTLTLYMLDYFTWQHLSQFRHFDYPRHRAFTYTSLLAPVPTLWSLQDRASRPAAQSPTVYCTSSRLVQHVEVYYNGNASERRSGHMTSSIWKGERNQSSFEGF